MIKKKQSIIAIIAVIIIILIIIFKIMTSRHIQNNNEMSLIINNQNIIANLENDIVVSDKIVYISMNDIKNNLDETIYYEEETNYIITTGDKKVAKLQLESDQIEINGSNVQIELPPFKSDEEIIYLPISELKNVYDIDCQYYEENKNVVIDYYSKSLTKANASKNIAIREEKSDFSLIIEDLKKDDVLVFIGEENGWAKVRTPKGNIGYVKKKYLTNIINERDDMEESLMAEDEEPLEKSISEKNIKNYEARKKFIDKLIEESILGEYTIVTIKYDGDKESEEFVRFKIESTAMLKECGINIKF